MPRIHQAGQNGKLLFFLCSLQKIKSCDHSFRDHLKCDEQSSFTSTPNSMEAAACTCIKNFVTQSNMARNATTQHTQISIKDETNINNKSVTCCAGSVVCDEN